eukprot:3908695-Prymnesium_polylepis.1
MDPQPIPVELADPSTTCGPISRPRRASRCQIHPLQHRLHRTPPVCKNQAQEARQQRCGAQPSGGR